MPSKCKGTASMTYLDLQVALNNHGRRKIRSRKKKKERLRMKLKEFPISKRKEGLPQSMSKSPMGHPDARTGIEHDRESEG